MSVTRYPGGNTTAQYIPPVMAGKNKIINGDFGVWQRGTTINPSATGWNYGADRWAFFTYTASSGTCSQQTFTLGTAPVAGYEGTYFARFTSTSTFNSIQQRIEDVRTFAGQTITMSFWAKSASAQTLSNLYLIQSFGSGGSSDVNTLGTPPTITTSWARYTATVTLPSISGKTIGAGNYLGFTLTGAINNALDIWGVQLEAGSVATPFTTATGTIQGELAACQRYYFRNNANAAYAYYALGNAISTSVVDAVFSLPVQMRIYPTSLDGSQIGINDGVTLVTGGTTTLLSGGTTSRTFVRYTHTASTLTTYRPYAIADNGSSGYIGFSAEL